MNGWTILRVGQDYEDGEFQAILVRDGLFHNGTGPTIEAAILSASLAEPYKPVQYSAQPKVVTHVNARIEDLL